MTSARVISASGLKYITPPRDSPVMKPAFATAFTAPAAQDGMLSLSAKAETSADEVSSPRVRAIVTANSLRVRLRSG